MKDELTIAQGTSAVVDVTFDIDNGEQESFEAFVKLRNSGFNFCQVGLVYFDMNGRHISYCCCQSGNDCLFNCQAYKNHTCPLYK